MARGQPDVESVEYPTLGRVPSSARSELAGKAGIERPGRSEGRLLLAPPDHPRLICAQFGGCFPATHCASIQRLPASQ